MELALLVGRDGRDGADHGSGRLLARVVLGDTRPPVACAQVDELPALGVYPEVVVDEEAVAQDVLADVGDDEDLVERAVPEVESQFAGPIDFHSAFCGCPQRWQ